MRNFFLLSLLWLLGPATNAQVASDYYRNPADTSLYSTALAQTRQLTIILPTTFNPNRKTKYPLIIVFDRQNKAIFRQLVESINYLNRFDEIPEAVIIGITSASEQRDLETSLPTDQPKAKGEQLIRFVFDELVPWSETNYNTGACRTLIGHSRFGYFTTVMMCRQADKLSGVISLSPFYTQGKSNWVDSVTTRFAKKQPLAHSLFYRFVTGDSLTDTPEYSLMKTALTKTQLHAHFDWQAYAFYKANHMVVPGLGVMPCLLDIFHEWSLMADELTPHSKSAPKISYEAFKIKTKQVYGEEVGLGLARLNGLGSKYTASQQYDKALFYWKQLIDDYPFFTSTYVDVADIYSVQGQPKEAAKYLQDGLQSLQSNTFLSVKAQEQLRQAIQQKLDRLAH